MHISKNDLLLANPDNVVRLAKSLKINVSGLSHREVVNRVYQAINKDGGRNR